MLDYEVGDDLSGSTLLEEEGTYHMTVTDFTDRPLDKEGRLLDNVDYDVYCEVLAGSVPAQEGKTYRLRFWQSKPDATDKSRAFRKKQRDRFWKAVNAISDEDRGGRVQIDPQWVVENAMQFVIKLEKTDKGYLEMHFHDVWHVDDPGCAGATKNEQALKNIRPEFRKIGSRPPASTTPPPPTATGVDQQQSESSPSTPAESGGTNDINYDAV